MDLFMNNINFLYTKIDFHENKETVKTPLKQEFVELLKLPKVKP